MKQHSEKSIQRRRFVMVLPLLAVPFMTLIFWALGGGQGISPKADGEDGAGLNPELPNAQFKNDENAWDKLSLYQQAQRDSLRYNEAKRNDPYFRLKTLEVGQDTDRTKTDTSNINTSLGKRSEPLDPNEELVNNKLKELTDHIARAGQVREKESASTNIRLGDSSFGSDVDRLEDMMGIMQDGAQEDSEMNEINGVLNKILDIQHPDRVKERLKQESRANSSNVFSVQLPADNRVTFIGATDSSQALDIDFNSSLPVHEVNGFYGIEGSIEESLIKAVEATIYNTQTVIPGSIVKIILESDIYVNGVLIPKGHFIYGICALSGERLTISIKSIQYENSIFPVDLSVYDLDGLEGIYVPGAIARDAAKQTSNQALQDIQLNSLDPSVEVQAATAGIEAAKGLLSKKSKMIRLTIKAGHKVLLKDNNSKS